jgi:hypothetical protein
LIPRSAAGKWRTALAVLHDRIFAESTNFHPFEAAVDLPPSPLDLMLVDDEVFVYSYGLTPIYPLHHTEGSQLASRPTPVLISHFGKSHFSLAISPR